MSAVTAPPNVSPPTGLRLWWLGARPRTLPAAVVPVAVGTALAHVDGGALIGRAALSLFVSLALQVGVNYSNDYSDGVRGTDDTGLRVGPPRLVGWKLAPASSVKAAAFASFGAAALAGLALAAMTTWWLLVVGVAAIAAAWFYTGGSRPYGYAGFGEVFVFVFFGLVAVVGTVFVQRERVLSSGWWAGAAVGLLATALLVTNNLRDIPGDTVVGKRTLAVRLGDQRTRRLYVGCVVVPFVLVVGLAIDLDTPLPLLAVVSCAAAIVPIRSVLSGVSGRDLIPVLAATARAQLVFGLALTVGLLLAA